LVKNPRAKFHQAALMASVDYGNNNIESVTFDQPLVLIPDLVEVWLKKSITTFKRYNFFQTKRYS